MSKMRAELSEREERLRQRANLSGSVWAQVWELHRFRENTGIDYILQLQFDVIMYVNVLYIIMYVLYCFVMYLM